MSNNVFFMNEETLSSGSEMIEDLFFIQTAFIAFWFDFKVFFRFNIWTMNVNAKILDVESGLSHFRVIFMKG